MVIVGVVAVITIAVTSYLYLGKQEQRFLDRLDDTSFQEFVFKNTEGDTVQIHPEETTVLLFWATWSDRSLDALYDLYRWHEENPGYAVIAAYVKDAPEFAREHDREGRDRYRLLDGTPVYQDLRIPGVPTTIIVDEQGMVTGTEIGTSNHPIWQTLPSERKREQAEVK